MQLPTPTHIRKHGLIGAVVALCLMFTGLTMQSAQAADTGSITGKVFTQAVGGTKTPATYVFIYLYRADTADGHYDMVDGDPDTDSEGFSFTGSTFTMPNLKAGYYKFEVAGVGNNSYQREYYNNKDSLSGATPIQVGTDAVPVSEMVLEPAGQITGKVTDRAGNPLANASVSFDDSDRGGSGSATTDANGNFTSKTADEGFGVGLVRGSYRVSARHDDYSNPDGKSYEQRYWQDSATYAGATPVAVTPGATTGSINIKLDVAPRLRLTVKDPAGQPVPNAPVGVFVFQDGSWGPIQSGPHETDAAGIYRSTLRIGAKFKFFIDPKPGVGGVKEWYDNAYTEATAKEVSATSYGQVIDIEIKLGAAPAVTGSTPTITGSPVVGQTLTATPGTWGPTGVALTYQWLAGGTPIAAATKATYAPVAADAGKALTVKVTGTLANHTPTAKTSAGTAAVTLPLVTGGTPTITGSPVVGQTLTAVPGTWGPTGVALTYQWLAGGTPINGATNATYKATTTDTGKALTVKVTGTLANHTPTTKTSAGTAAVTLPLVTGGTPTITGSPLVGQTLTATPGTWGPTGVALTYQWLAGGTPIAAATQATYSPVAADAGKALTVKVTGTLANHTAATKESAPTAAVALQAVVGATPVITGTPRTGQTLTARPGTWGPAGVKLSQQWFASGVAIRGATGTTFRVTNTQAGKSITVRVTGLFPNATPVVRSSAATARATGVLTPKKVSISGSKKVGKKLRADTAAWGPKPVKLSYKWYRNGKAISGQTSRYYKLRKADKGKRISVRVYQRKTSYLTANKLSSKTSKIK